MLARSTDGMALRDCWRDAPAADVATLARDAAGPPRLSSLIFRMCFTRLVLLVTNASACVTRSQSKTVCREYLKQK